LVDIQRFAERSFDEDIILPVLCSGEITVDRIPLWLKAEYDVQETPVEALGLTRAVTEHDVYVATRRWSEDCPEYVGVDGDNFQVQSGSKKWIEIRISMFNRILRGRFPLLCADSPDITQLFRDSSEERVIQIPALIVTRTFGDGRCTKKYRTMFVAKCTTVTKLEAL